MAEVGVATIRAGSKWRLPSAIKADADALLFSAKTFAAAMLAYYVALRIGLPKPYWAIGTVYIVSQTSAGASLGRGVYRFAGTVVGAVATVAIIPNFANDPVACSVVLACWIGACLYFSLLDRTPRAYAFVLAGYTASLIGFPSVLDPGAIFETASVRVQEISIGILCAVLIHRFVFPRRMTGQFIGTLSATLQEARRLASDALRGAPGKETRRDRHQLAVDLLALQGLSTYLPYDPAPVTPRRETLQQIHDRLARLLPLATEIEDRVHARGREAQTASDQLAALLGDVEIWITNDDAAAREGLAKELIDRARLLHIRLGADEPSFGERLAANVAGHLAEMVALLCDCDRLQRSLATGDALRADEASHRPGSATGYVFHRDRWMAARAALGAIAGIILGCAFWIWSAWPDGGTAVSILGVCCALFGNVDAPAPNVIKYLVGSIYGAAISAAYSFVILPQVTDFAVLVAVLAPAFLFAGSMQARPPTTFMALGITLTIPILSGLGATYTGDFAAFINSATALLVATGFGVVSMTLLQTVPADAAIKRLLRLSRRDVRQRALGYGPDEAQWTSLMVDRTALLLPRLRLSRNAQAGVLDDTVHHLRIGHVVGQIRGAIPYHEGEIGGKMNDLLLAIAACFNTARRKGPREAIGLDRQIETLMALVAGSAIENRSSLLDLLMDLRFALGVRSGERGS